MSALQEGIPRSLEGGSVFFPCCDYCLGTLEALVASSEKWKECLSQGEVVKIPGHREGTHRRETTGVSFPQSHFVQEKPPPTVYNNCYLVCG